MNKYRINYEFSQEKLIINRVIINPCQLIRIDIASVLLEV